MFTLSQLRIENSSEPDEISGSYQSSEGPVPDLTHNGGRSGRRQQKLWWKLVEALDETGRFRPIFDRY